MYGKILKRPLHKTDEKTIMQYSHQQNTLSTHERDLQKLILNLTVYRASLCQQISSLQAWAERDEAETHLELLQIYDAEHFYCQQFQTLRNQLKEMAIKYENLQNQKKTIYMKNQTNAQNLTLAMEQRDKKLVNKNNISKQNELLMQRIQTEKEHLQAQEGKNQSLLKRIKDTQTQISTLKMKVQLIQNDKSNKEIEIKLKQQESQIQTKSNKLTQDKLSSLKKQAEQVQKGLQKLKMDKQTKRVKLAELYTTFHIISARADAESDANLNIQSNFDDCLKNLQARLEYLQSEQRTRQYIEDKISTLKSNKIKSTQQISRLMEYKAQLQTTNKNMMNLLTKYRNQDKQEACKLKLKIQQNQKNYESETMFNQSNNNKKVRRYSQQISKSMERQIDYKQINKKERPLMETLDYQFKQNKQSRLNCMPKHIDEIIKKYRGTDTENEQQNRVISKYQSFISRNNVK